MPVPAGSVLAGGDPYSTSAALALSPNGRALAFVATSESRARLWLRSFDAVEPRSLPGTEGASFPFWSPDGRFIAFFAEGKLKKLEVGGGVVQPLADALEPRGGTWSKDGLILYAPRINGPLFQISANGGEARPATTLDRTRSEFGHRWPHFLSGGPSFLFYARTNSESAVLAGSLGSENVGPVARGISRAEYVEPGYLLFSRAGALMAQRFDARRLVTDGDAVRIVEGVIQETESGATGNAVLSAAADGTVAFARGRGLKQLVWVDRQGNRQETVGAVGTWDEPDLSPDGSRLAINADDPGTGERNILRSAFVSRD